MSAAPITKRRLAPSRESLASINDDGSHVRLHPADVRGRFTIWRRIVAVALVAVYVSLPWIPVRGQPAVFLDVLNLRFHFFGLTFAAQDLWLAFFLITGLGFSLFFVTALFGRLWCGWACPQTVFLEHVYRRIERALEGDAARRRLLDAAPWTTEKVLRRGTKLFLFVLVSLAIAHVMLAYFVSLPREWEMITHSPLQHWGLFVVIVIATTLLFLNFAFFREQLCIILCPYGRLQSALIDDHSLAIGYDTKRGEPRGKRQKSEDGGQKTEQASQNATLSSAISPLSSVSGDCIDCFRCVQVCPTGIDIRQGLQLECIGCANCIDACDEVMTRLQRPRGLVRYDSLNGLAGLKTRFLRPRIFVYSFLLLAGFSVAAFSVSRYQPANLNTVRMLGAPYYVDRIAVRNQFLVRVINKQIVPASFTLRVEPVGAAPAGLRWSGWEEAVSVAPNGEEVRPLIVFAPREAYEGKFKIRLRVAVTPGDLVLTRELDFAGPDPRLLKDDDAREKEHKDEPHR